jgi:hypothetical protein
LTPDPTTFFTEDIVYEAVVIEPVVKQIEDADGYMVDAPLMGGW